MAASPIGFLDKRNADVLLAVTPEYRQIRKAQQASGMPLQARPGPFAMKPEFCTVAGKKLRFARGGVPDGPVILLLCPLPQSIIAFDQIWPALTERYRVVALDLPGFGRSEGGNEVMTFAAQSHILDEFIQEQDLEDLHIVGPDIGMPVALHYAIHRKHRATSLIIGDGPAIVPSANGSIINKAVNSAFWRMVFRIAGAGAFVEGGNRLACVNYRFSDEEVADYVASYKGRIGPVTEWFRSYPQSLATIDPHLAELEIPVKIFWGDLDMFLFPETGEQLKKRLKRSDLTVFKNCGHYSYEDARDEFAHMVLEWVESGHTAL